MAETPDQDIIQPLFPTYLAVSEYPNFSAERETLLQAVYSMRDQDHEGRQRTVNESAVGYTSYFTHTNLHEREPFKALAQFISTKAHKYAVYQHLDLQNFVLSMQTFWINISSQHCYHAEHIHPYSHISGVVYLAASRDSGDILFRDPRAVRSMVMPPVSEYAQENSDVYTLAPVEGRVLMFPPWLTHGVLQNRTTADRVSMSFNFELLHR